MRLRMSMVEGAVVDADVAVVAEAGLTDVAIGMWSREATAVVEGVQRATVTRTVSGVTIDTSLTHMDALFALYVGAGGVGAAVVTTLNSLPIFRARTARQVLLRARVKNRILSSVHRERCFAR